MSAQAIADRVIAHVADRPCYLTFDIDCLDPAYAPGTGTPVRGGPSSARMLSVLRKLGALDIRGSDIVEVAPATTMPISPQLQGQRLRCICSASVPKRWPPRVERVNQRVGKCDSALPANALKRQDGPMKRRSSSIGEHGTTGLQIRTRMAGRADVELLSIPEAERRNQALRAELLNAADIAILCLRTTPRSRHVAMLKDNPKVASSTPRPPTGFIRTGPTALPKWTRRRRKDCVRAAGRQFRVATRQARSASSARCGRPASCRRFPPSPSTPSPDYTGGGKQMIAQMEEPNHPDAITAPHFLFGLPLKHKLVPEMKTHGLLDRSAAVLALGGQVPARHDRAGPALPRRTRQKRNARNHPCRTGRPLRRSIDRHRCAARRK